MNFYKITNEEEKHNGLQYKTGLNVDPLPWNPSGDCAPGGIYFSREDILAFIEYGSWIRKVDIQEGVEIYENPGEPKKWKAHEVVLEERRRIDVNVIKGLLEEGADIHIDEELTLKWASENGHLEIVELMIEHVANIHARRECALKWASNNGHFEIVKLLLEHGANVHAVEDCALRWASAQGQLEVIKLLIKHGAYANAKGNGALKAARINGHKKVAEFLLKHGASQ